MNKTAFNESVVEESIVVDGEHRGNAREDVSHA
jgi:hypothetical protein